MPPRPAGWLTRSWAPPRDSLAASSSRARPRVQPARSAVGHLAGQVAGLLDRMASDLADDEQDGTALEGTALTSTGNDLTGEAAQWLTQARALRDEIERVDDTLREAADSTRLNPRALVTPAGTAQATETTVALRGGVEALEHAALTLRGLARSVLDSAASPPRTAPSGTACTRVRLASVLAKLGEAIRTYGRLVQLTPAGDESLESELAAELEEAHGLQDELADLLKPRIGDGGEPSEWPLRGEILTHVDRLRTVLSVEAVDALAHVQRSAAHRRRARPRKGRGRPHVSRSRSHGCALAVSCSAGRRGRAARPRGRGRPSPPRCWARRQ